MSDEKVTLYRISLLEALLVVATSGFWIIVIYWLNGVEVSVPDDAA